MVLVEPWAIVIIPLQLMKLIRCCQAIECMWEKTVHTVSCFESVRSCLMTELLGWISYSPCYYYTPVNVPFVSWKRTSRYGVITVNHITFIAEITIWVQSFFPQGSNGLSMKWMGRDSSVSIVTGYGLDGLGIESQWGRDFPHPSRPALEPTQPPIQWVLRLSRR